MPDFPRRKLFLARSAAAFEGAAGLFEPADHIGFLNMSLPDATAEENAAGTRNLMLNKSSARFGWLLVGGTTGVCLLVRSPNGPAVRRFAGGEAVRRRPLDRAVPPPGGAGQRLLGVPPEARP